MSLNSKGIKFYSKRNIIGLLITLLLYFSINISNVVGSENIKGSSQNSSKKEGKKISDVYHEYSALIKTLRENGITIEEQYRNNVMNYLQDRKGFSLIGFSPSREGLRWNFYNPVFLRQDLLFISYEDGEMYGGHLLIKIVGSKNNVVSMRKLWNSAGN